MDELTKVSHKLAEEIYKQAAAKQQASGKQSTGAGPQQEQAGGQEEGPAKAGGEDIIDAEYKEEDDKK
jgi:molecular chaperone DnaK